MVHIIKKHPKASRIIKNDPENETYCGKTKSLFLFLIPIYSHLFRFIPVHTCFKPLPLFHRQIRFPLRHSSRTFTTIPTHRFSTQTRYTHTHNGQQRSPNRPTQTTRIQQPASRPQYHYSPLSQARPCPDSSQSDCQKPNHRYNTGSDQHTGCCHSSGSQGVGDDTRTVWLVLQD